MVDQHLLTLVADIVVAHSSNSSAKPADLPLLIESVYATLEGLGRPAPLVEEKREPAVSIRSSVEAGAITCLECGARQKMLKRHLGSLHQLTPAEYRARWGLNADYPMVALDYVAMRRDLAVKLGLGRKPGTKVKRSAKPKAAATRKPKAAKGEAAVDGF